MKKILLSLSLLCVTLGALASVVPSDKAYDVAQRFMGSTDLVEVWDGNETGAKASRDPAFRVFNVKGGGWVIVSGDDCTVPILAYSDTGTFVEESIPPSMRWWLESMRDSILKARSEQKDAGDQIQEKWNHPERIDTKAGGTRKQLDTPAWGQEYPYNSLLSQYVTKNGVGVEDLLAGCVATAMAELLRFYRWPEHGFGTLPSYTTDSKKYSVSGFSIDDHIYDWDNMPMSFDASSTETQKAAVAQLMLDCGVMVQMDYRTDADGGSGAFVESIIPAMIEHFGYSRSAVIEERGNYTDEAWLRMIKEDIDKGQPVLYSGYTDDYRRNGHQFMCDGYDMSEQRLHINWGWNGEHNNAWFTLALSTESGVFSKGQIAIFGLAPDRDNSSTYPNPVLSIESDPEGGQVNGVSVSSGRFASGETFTVDAGSFFNNSYGIEYNGAVKAVLVDKDGNIKQDASEAVDMTGLAARERRSLEGIVCSVGNVSFGDRIKFLYRLNDNSWTTVQTNSDDFSYPWQLAYVDACFIKTKSSYRAGDKFTLTIIPGNRGITGIAWTYDGSPVSAASVTLSSGTHAVSAELTFSDGTAETITQVLEVN